MHRFIRVGFLLLSLAINGIGSFPADRLPSEPPPPGLVEVVGERNMAGVQYSQDPGNGRVRFLSFREDNPAARPRADETARGVSPGDAYLARYGGLFGLGQPGEGMRQIRSSESERAQYIRYQQTLEGLPVLGGEIIIQTDRGGRLMSMSGRVMSEEITPQQVRISAEEAVSIAKSAVLRQVPHLPTELTAERVEQVVYDPHLLDSLDTRPAVRVWQVEVRAGDPAVLREYVLVDVQSGIVQLHFNLLDTALNRAVYDFANSSASGTLVRTEGSTPSGLTDADLAYTYSGMTYDFFWREHQRDGINGAGMQIISYTRYCPVGATCPYGNAYWDGAKMVYGQGYASADDVVAHELTHGVTDYESALYYYMQSGAINEAFSDAWGEFVDLTNGVGNDTAGVRWLMGEDLGMIIRSMTNPPLYGDPDRMTSTYYYCGTGDGGGVHTNSGVLNKAVALMTDGGSFNGQVIQGLGISKTADILYEVQTNLLTSGGEYYDLFSLLPQACYTLGNSAQDCQQVERAVLATEMNLQPTSCAKTIPQVSCPAGLSPVPLYSEKFDTPDVSVRWYKDTYENHANEDRWFLGTFYARSGLNHLYAEGDPVVNAADPLNVIDASVVMSNRVALPSDPSHPAYLSFWHAYAMDYYAPYNYDGGRVEYSLDDVNWYGIEDFPVVNGPNGTVLYGYGNPLADMTAFTGNSHGWLRTVADLSLLAGDTVRFRYRLGTDDQIGSYWMIDDMEISTCMSLPYHAQLPAVFR